MANDAPSSLRMEFGATAAHGSGVVDFTTPPSPGQMSYDIAWRKAEHVLRHIRINHPEMGPIIREIIACQKTENRYSAQEILRVLWRNNLYYRPMNTKHQP